MEHSRISDDEKNITCIVCPTGCTINVKRMEDGTLQVHGNECKRGLKYATAEFTAPTRILATTVKILGAKFPLVPVRSDIPLPKDRLFDVLDFLATIEVEAPVKCGDVIVPRVLGLEGNIIATRTMTIDDCTKIACET
ncbi:MAG: DUF1667 domain-containing protein [Promethearchaeota archaeon]